MEDNFFFGQALDAVALAKLLGGRDGKPTFTAQVQAASGPLPRQCKFDVSHHQATNEPEFGPSADLGARMPARIKLELIAFLLPMGKDGIKKMKYRAKRNASPGRVLTFVTNLDPDGVELKSDEVLVEPMLTYLYKKEGEAATLKMINRIVGVMKIDGLDIPNYFKSLLRRMRRY